MATSLADAQAIARKRAFEDEMYAIDLQAAQDHLAIASETGDPIKIAEANANYVTAAGQQQAADTSLKGAAKSGNAAFCGSRTVCLQIDLQSRTNKQIARVVTCCLTEGPIGTH